jgi:hypothetical protein
MNKIVEELMKEREPVHPKCQGIGFTDKELSDLKKEFCSRIEPVEIFEIIDEETETIDAEAGSKPSFTDPACRCTAYVRPERWWIHGRNCPLADHFKPIVKDASIVKERAGQQKQKKKK